MPEHFACPYCEYSDDRLGVHGHLVDDHENRLGTEILSTEQGHAIQISLVCPECDTERFSKEIPRPMEDAGRVIEVYREELSMVAFDQLLYHLEDEHEY